MSELRSAAVMFADIAAATQLRNSVGDRQADAMLDPVLNALREIVLRNGGDVLKSDGDDVLAVFDRAGTCVDDAANAAIECQLAARSAGRKLYVGLDAGVVEFREVLGRPDVAGMPVNMAARLHKLVPDLAGCIFMARDTVQSLRPDLRDRARPYGTRPIKGVGPVDVHTLDWDEAVTVVPTRFAMPSAPVNAAVVLGITHAGRSLRLAPDSPALQVGRDRNNELRIEDDEQRVSSRHLKILNRNGAWILQDTSRNGTWVRFNQNPNNPIGLLGDELKLVGDGRMCLGRPFADDAQGRFTVHFEMVRK
jgi:adenylate cyclase